jgi:low affinity Fe/Cu permease
MNIADALQIVIDLARKAQDFGVTLDHEGNANVEEAIAIVEDMAVNQFGDD